MLEPLAPRCLLFAGYSCHPPACNESLVRSRVDDRAASLHIASEPPALLQKLDSFICTWGRNQSQLRVPPAEWRSRYLLGMWSLRGALLAVSCHSASIIGSIVVTRADTVFFSPSLGAEIHSFAPWAKPTELFVPPS